MQPVFAGVLMNNKEIQEQRMRGYFIDAAKNILKSEGLRSVSVRSIADKAGYSYATMYNYFKDVKELIFICVKDFQEECAEVIAAETRMSPRGVEKLKAITKSYMKYFVQYPGIFELFFLELISDMSVDASTLELIVTFLSRLCDEEWTVCIENKVFSEDEAALLKERLNYTVTGLLLFYINRKYPESYPKFVEAADRQLEALFRT